MKVWICQRWHPNNEDCVISAGDARPLNCPVCVELQRTPEIASVDVVATGRAGGPDCWSPKTLGEMLNGQRMYLTHIRQPTAAREVLSNAMRDLQGLLELARPVASNGKHGNQHTALCGCENR